MAVGPFEEKLLRERTPPFPASQKQEREFALAVERMKCAQRRPPVLIANAGAINASDVTAD